MRVHSGCLTGDVFGSKRCDCGDQLHRAMEMVRQQEGKGVILYLNQEGRGIGLLNKSRRIVFKTRDGIRSRPILNWALSRIFATMASALRFLWILD